MSKRLCITYKLTQQIYLISFFSFCTTSACLKQPHILLKLFPILFMHATTAHVLSKNISRHDSDLYFLWVLTVRFAACGSSQFIGWFSPSNDQRHMYNLWTYTTDIPHKFIFVGLYHLGINIIWTVKEQKLSQ